MNVFSFSNCFFNYFIRKKKLKDRVSILHFCLIFYIFFQLDVRLVPRLNKSWPDLKSTENNGLWDNNNQWFWGREYNKHGSCTFVNENVYFNLALTMAENLGDLISQIRGCISFIFT